MSETYKFSHNNSGGRWWLQDKDWKALEDAGWRVQWGGLKFCGAKYDLREGREPEKRPRKPCAEDCQGHRMFESYESIVAAGKDARWLGALAQYATKDFDSARAAVEEWERITGRDFFAEGCNCCGAPFSISGGKGKAHEYVSGDSVERTTVRPW